MPGTESSLRLSVLLTLLLIAVSLSIYSNIFFHQFVYDDHQTIVENDLITNWKNLPLLFQGDYFRLSGEQSFRPLVTLTYFIDYSLWKLNPSGYHATNLLIHTINGVVLFFVLALLTKETAVIFLFIFLAYELMFAEEGKGSLRTRIFL